MIRWSVYRWIGFLQEVNNNPGVPRPYWDAFSWYIHWLDLPVLQDDEGAGEVAERVGHVLQEETLVCVVAVGGAVLEFPVKFRAIQLQLTQLGQRFRCENVRPAETIVEEIQGDVGHGVGPGTLGVVEMGKVNVLDGAKVGKFLRHVVL